jgi:hypothetical protein
MGCVCFRSDLDSGDGVSEEEAEEGHYSQYDELGRTPPRTQLSRYVRYRYIFVVWYCLFRDQFEAYVCCTGYWFTEQIENLQEWRHLIPSFVTNSISMQYRYRTVSFSLSTNLR